MHYGVKVLLNIYDLSGNEEYKYLYNKCFTDKEVYIIVYSVTDRESFESV